MPFEDFLGNDHCVKLLRQTLQRNRVPPALLFSGPDAVGKRLLGKHLALALNCLDTGIDNWCGACSQCRLIELGHHPDVRLIEPEGQVVKIEQVRSLAREASYKPFQGRTKVFILDEAHRLNMAAANALLKTLEEPPSSSKLVLITSKPHSLLPTVRSRCQALHFAPLKESEIREILQDKYQMGLQDARKRARFAEGSLGKALTLDPRHFESIHNSAQSFLNLALHGADLDQASKLSWKISKDRDTTEEWLRRLFIVIRGELHASVARGENDAVPSLPQLVAMARAADELRRGLEHHVNRNLALDSLFLRFSDIVRGCPQ